jgi:hypothetical protein
MINHRKTRTQQVALESEIFRFFRFPRPFRPLRPFSPLASFSAFPKGHRLSPTVSPLCHGSDLMITLSLLVRHRVTAKTPIQTGSAFLLLILILILILPKPEIACCPPPRQPEIACDSLCHPQAPPQPISVYLRLSQAISAKTFFPLLLPHFCFLLSAFPPRLSTAIRGHPRLSTAKFFLEDGKGQFQLFSISGFQRFRSVIISLIYRAKIGLNRIK